MPKENEVGEQVRVPHAIVEKFGQGYRDEVPVRVGGYDFYVDILQLGEDLSRHLSEAGVGWTVESRRHFLEMEKDTLISLAEMLDRYEVSQNMIQGVGKVGSTLYLELSLGEKDGKKRREKIYVSDHQGEISFFADKNLSDFGIPCIGDGQQRYIPVFEKNLEVKTGAEIGNNVIDDVPNRLRYLVQEMGRGGIMKKIDKEMFAAQRIFEITDGDSKRKAEVALAFMLDKIDFVDFDYPPVGKAELGRDIERQFEDTFSNSLSSLAADQRRARFLSNENRSEVGFEEGVFGRVEKALLNGDRILILPPEGLSFLPAVYMAIQIIADRYKIEGQKKASDSDIAAYWRNVVFDVNAVGYSRPGTLLMVQNLYKDWDADSGYRDDVREAIDSLDSDGRLTSVVEMHTENVLEKRVGEWRVVSYRDNEGRIVEKLRNRVLGV